MSVCIFLTSFLILNTAYKEVKERNACLHILKWILVTVEFTEVCEITYAKLKNKESTLVRRSHGISFRYLALAREKELMLHTVSCRNKIRFLEFWVKTGCKSTVSSCAETTCPSCKAVSGFHCDLQRKIIFFPVKFAANGDTSSFFKYAAAGNDIVIFGLRSGLQFSLHSFYSRGKEFTHLCPYHINSVTAGMKLVQSR